MRAPRFTKKVLAGLRTISGNIGAGSSADFLGYNEDQLERFAAEGDGDGKRAWENVSAACAWIDRLEEDRALRHSDLNARVVRLLRAAHDVIQEEVLAAGLTEAELEENPTIKRHADVAEEIRMFLGSVVS